MRRAITGMMTAAALVIAQPVAITAPAAVAQSNAKPAPWMNRSLSPDARAAQLQAQMTLPEKVALATGSGLCGGPQGDGFVAGDPRLGIPDLGLVGAGMGVTDVCSLIPGDRVLNGKATELPAPLAMAASFDPSIAFADGAVIGRETRALGFNVSIGGDVNLARDPRNGRTFEAEGEDPVLAGTIVAAQIRGIQAQHVPSTIKHFAMNDEETYRVTQSSSVSERTMRELELRAFQIGVRDGNPAAVMCSYNKVNGTPACESKHLLDEVLKREWAFKGWVMTDWWACAFPGERNPANLCTTSTAANAGLDQIQPVASFFGSALEDAVRTGQVPRSRLDDMVHRILRSLFAYGVFDYPVAPHPVDTAAGADAAERVAERSAVLLKNDRGALPLDARQLKSLAVIGAPATQPSPHTPSPSSAYVNPIAPDTPLGAIADVAPHVTVRYDAGIRIAAATALASRSDAVIVFARDTMREGSNLPSLSLDGNADRLIEAVARANRRTIVVLETGTTTTMPWLRQVPAVLEAWWPGERGGHAIARILFGQVNPSGRLPLTFPATVSELPTAGSLLRWPGTPSDIQYSEGLNIGYRWYDARGIKPLFPFGFGLSYGARWRFSDLRVTNLLAAPNHVAESRWAATVSFTVANAGTRAARAVPEIYAGLPASTGEPPRRLVAFENLTLAPGRRVRLHVRLSEAALDYWSRRWRIAPGHYTIWVGASSRDLPLSAGFATTREP